MIWFFSLLLFLCMALTLVWAYRETLSEDALMEEFIRETLLEEE